MGKFGGRGGGGYGGQSRRSSGSHRSRTIREHPVETFAKVNFPNRADTSKHNPHPMSEKETWQSIKVDVDESFNEDAAYMASNELPDDIREKILSQLTPEYREMVEKMIDEYRRYGTLNRKFVRDVAGYADTVPLEDAIASIGYVIT